MKIHKHGTLLLCAFILASVLALSLAARILERHSLIPDLNIEYVPGPSDDKEKSSASSGKNVAKFVKKSRKKTNFKLNYEIRNSRFVCKTCGLSVVAKYYRQHIREKHPNLCRTYDTQSSWSPKKLEDLVRFVGEYIRQNKNPNLRDNKAINWSHIAKKMNHSNGCKLSPYQIRKKWDNMVFRLPEVPIEEAKQMSEINGYVFVIKYLLLLKNK